MAGLSFQGLQQSMPSPVASDVGPSLVAHEPEGTVRALWKGSKGDQRIWSATFDGTSWSEQQSLPDPIATAYRPSVAIHPGTTRRLYAAWRGSDDDERIWFSFYEATIVGHTRADAITYCVQCRSISSSLQQYHLCCMEGKWQRSEAVVVEF
jgi:hypothetical protein